MRLMATGPGVMTAEELLQLPDGARHELVRGHLRVMPLAGHVHGRIAARIGARLTTFVDAHRLGVTFAAETGFLLQRQPDTVRAPDASFVSNARLAVSNSPSQGYFSGPPDIAIEVLSPSDRRSRVAEKTEAWLVAGCIAVVVLDPSSESATIHRSSGQTEPIASDGELSVPEVLPGWSVSLRDIFRLGIG
jgi:Uma2 family endonuclease